MVTTTRKPVVEDSDIRPDSLEAFFKKQTSIWPPEVKKFGWYFQGTIEL